MDTVKEIRRRKGWSQKDLAEESGVGQDTISGIESGRHEPRPSTLRKLADALDVEVADFFREPAVPLADAPEAGPSLLDKGLDAARHDEEKDSRARARLRASEGLQEDILHSYKEDEFRAELRGRGFPDEYFEGFIWPLIVRTRQATLQAERLEQENARLREERGREPAQRR